LPRRGILFITKRNQILKAPAELTVNIIGKALTILNRTLLAELAIFLFRFAEEKTIYFFPFTTNGSLYTLTFIGKDPIYINQAAKYHTLLSDYHTLLILQSLI